MQTEGKRGLHQQQEVGLGLQHHRLHRLRRLRRRQHVLQYLRHLEQQG